jgi:hypothetical protein
MSSHIDTRDLIIERNATQETILDAFNSEFTTDYTEYSEIDFEVVDNNKEFQELWKDELNSIREIDELESDIDNGEFDSGTTLIEEDDFEEFVEQDLEDCGYISKDFPTWIEINWEATANNVRQDYSEVEFRGNTYLYR